VTNNSKGCSVGGVCKQYDLWHEKESLTRHVIHVIDSVTFTKRAGICKSPFMATKRGEPSRRWGMLVTDDVTKKDEAHYDELRENDQTHQM